MKISNSSNTFYVMLELIIFIMAYKYLIHLKYASQQNDTIF
jgi:hypothetical protein